jgi:hypothetical protein
MRKFLVSIGVLLLPAISGVAQIKKQFSIEPSEDFEKVEVKFMTKSGVCYIKPSQHDTPLSIYSNQDFDDYEHTFSKSIVERKCYVDLSLTDKNSDDLSKSISSRMFNSSDKDKHKMWKVYLSDNTPYNLDLHYGMGEAFIDLSGLSIENLKVNSGNADVNIGFMSGLGNQVSMDTFFVKVDLGSVNVQKMNMSKAGLVMADIGFGNLYLDYNDVPEQASQVKASVGAGNLVVKVPKKNVPVIVKINDSMLCRIRLSRSFTEIEENTFVNAAYTDDADNLLSFEVDVSLGTIVFKEVD